VFLPIANLVKDIIIEAQTFYCCRLIGFTPLSPLSSASEVRLCLYKYLLHTEKQDPEKGGLCCVGFGGGGGAGEGVRPNETTGKKEWASLILLLLRENLVSKALYGT
jgi:hypothetical protein